MQRRQVNVAAAPLLPPSVDIAVDISYTADLGLWVNVATTLLPLLSADAAVCGLRRHSWTPPLLSPRRTWTLPSTSPVDSVGYATAVSWENYPMANCRMLMANWIWLKLLSSICEKFE
jgi:hypothetical protein